MISRHIQLLFLGIGIFLSATAITIGVTSFVAQKRILDQQEFASRSAALTKQQPVRTALNQAIVDAAIDSGSADLISARPVLEAVVAEITQTKAFRQLVYTSAIRTHQLAFENKQPKIFVDLANVATLTREALQSISPRIAKKIPKELNPELLQITLPPAVRQIREVKEVTSTWSMIILGGGAILLFITLLFCRSWRARTITILTVFALSGLSLAAYLHLARMRVLAEVQGSNTLTQQQARKLIASLWDGYLGDLPRIGISVAIVSFTAAIIFATRTLPRMDKKTRQTTTDWWSNRGKTKTLLALNSGLILAGLIVILQPHLAAEVQTQFVGLVFIIVGIHKLATVLAKKHTFRYNASFSHTPDQHWKALATGLLLSVTLFCVVVGVTAPKAKQKQANIPERGCNGIPQLCKLRLNQALFPGTHNSMSAGDEPGWYFANQRYSIERQLQDGIRLFLIDPHYGSLQKGKKIVRTDLQAEGSSRNRVAAQLSPKALRAAEQLVGRIGFGDLTGNDDPYLCHTLCELGSLKMIAALKTYRHFLEREPGAVIVLFLESSVNPKEIEQTFRQAGLLSYVASLDREKPLPTLGDLVKSNHRVIVLSERETGGLSWYAPGFSFVQDTPLGRRSTTSCRLSRGSQDSPLFMINHWVDSFPPPRNANRRIESKKALLNRLRRCERERKMPVNLFAVDHYDTGKIIQLAKEVNLQRVTKSQ